MSTDSSPKPFRWLHLTDLHVGKNVESQKQALRTLLTAVERFSNGKNFDVVFLTGDLANAGLQSQYEMLETELLAPLRGHALTRDAQIYAVPGNHDLDCDADTPINWAGIGKSRQEKYFHFGEDGRKVRRGRAVGFAEYAAFLERNGINGVNPQHEPAKRYDLDVCGRKVTIITAVTAFFSDREVSDQNKTPAPVAPLRELTLAETQDAQTIILGHHPVDWFLQETRNPFRSLLIEKRAIYVHGHEHQLKATFGPQGLSQLGFGAGYVAPSDATPTTFYRNTFAICELTDSMHVAIYCWDAENGNWRVESQLPGEFQEPSEILTAGYRFNLPSTRLNQANTRQSGAVAAALRSDLEFENPVWLVKTDMKKWVELLQKIGMFREDAVGYALPTQLLPTGHVEFRIQDARGQHLIYAVSGPGDILNYEQIKSINTELDTQDYESCIIVTLGSLAREADTLAQQLASRKPITVLERNEFIRLIRQHFSPTMEAVLRESNERGDATGSLVFTDSGIGLLLHERTNRSWFQVIDENGAPVSEASDLTARVRDEIPRLRAVRYRSAGGTIAAPLLGAQTSLHLFDKTEYLSKCRAYFDNVRYAPLAALGFRFEKASLSEIYVEASADVGGSNKSSETLTRSISEFVESFNLNKSQRDQLESQLRSRHGLSRSAEVGAARKLYQRYNNVIVLGDPGSGKTCFVQHEILAYCTPPEGGRDWYSHHLPVYVSLAEAARLINDKTSLLDVCEIVSSRRGIDLPRSTIESYLADGRVAFFFDGLDEVGFIDSRITLLGEISSLMNDYAAKGNRFALASRPAAIQPVEIPENLTYLHLKGLTEEEIRTLAGRVLISRVGDHDGNALSQEQEELVERLLDDTRNSPGIARIARNPLLLTLLVLIYANSGAISAKRHLIYSQAVKTLVSVRGRYTREQRISEADLRLRLGALAFAIFARKVAEIPKRSEVVDLLTPIVCKQSNGNSSGDGKKTTEAFLQEVAEATGLISIHMKGGAEAEDLVTFMHYSFLEYYCAAGLLAKPDPDKVADLSGNPRWKDVITLLFGILSEQGDITPQLDKILASATEAERITEFKTLLAIDCANECDVPPEESQAIVSDALYKSMTIGAGRYSSRVRSDLAERIPALLRSCGAHFEEVVIKGLRDPNQLVGAAFADLLSRIDEDIFIPDQVSDAFKDLLKRDNPVTRAACLYAIEQRPEFRTDAAREIVRVSLKGSIVEKHAALKVIGALPAFGPGLVEDMKPLLDDSNTVISTAAALCLISIGVKASTSTTRPAYFEKALSKINQDADRDTGLSLRGVAVDHEQVAELIGSDDLVSVEMAIRHVPLIRDNDPVAHKLLMDQIREPRNNRIRAVALHSLRHCQGAIDLITIADTDLVCRALEDGDRSVRLGAVSLLAALPDDEQVVKSLQRYLLDSSRSTSREVEVAEAAKALANHVRRNPRLRSRTIQQVSALLPKDPEKGFGNEKEQAHISALLSVCESIGGTTEDNTAWKLFRLAESFKTPLNLRKQCYRVFGRLIEPSEEGAKAFVTAIERNDSRVNESVYAGAYSFISQCHRRVEYVRSVHGVLDSLLAAFLAAWRREISNASDSIEPPSLRDLREGIGELGNLVLAYNEFSQRAKLVG